MAKLDVKAFGFACGIIWGAGMLILGLAGHFFAYGAKFGEAMASIYIGYTPTLLGSVIGGIWGFIDATIGGIIVAWLYNKLAK